MTPRERSKANLQGGVRGAHDTGPGAPGVGAAIRAARYKAGMSGGELSAAVGKHKGWIAQVELGSSKATPQQLRAIAAALSLPADTFVRIVAAVPDDISRWLLAAPERLAEVRRLMIAAVPASAPPRISLDAYVASVPHAARTWGERLLAGEESQ